MQKETTIGLKELRLGACLTGPSKAMLADLESLAMACNVARTAMIKAWERWCDDNKWTRHAALDKDGNPKLTKNGKPIYANEPMPAKVGDVTGSTYLYHKGRDAAPHVSSSIMAQLSQEVWDHLRANVPYNHTGKAFYRWEAILMNEDTRTCYRNLAIPMPSRDCIFAYQADLSKEPSKGVAAELRRMSMSSAVIRIPMYSNVAGRAHKALITRVEVRQLSRGNKRILHKIATGEWQMRDSKIVKKKNGIWCFQLTYHQPLRDFGLLVQNNCVLTSHQGGDVPFTAMRQVAVDRCDEVATGAISDETKGENRGPKKPWTLGNVNVLLEQYKRLDLRRKAMRGDYRVAGSGVKGHGKQRFFRDVAKVTRQAQNLMERFAELAVADAIKFCIRYDCGTLTYLEPAPAMREHYWFNRHGVPFDWTRFLAELTHKCHLNSIVLKVERPVYIKKDEATKEVSV